MTATPVPAPVTTSEIALPLALALIAGTVDVTTFVLLGGLFSAHITGNVVVLAADLALHRPLDPAGIIAIPLFIAVTALLALLVDRSATTAWTWTHRLLAVQGAFVLLAGVVAIATGAKAATPAGLLVGMLAVAGMATQNALLHLTFRKAPTTAVMTGNIVGATVALVGLLVRGRQDAVDVAAWRRSWPLIVGFFAGCLAGALACGGLGAGAWLLPIALSAAVLIGSLLIPAPPEIRSAQPPI